MHIYSRRKDTIRKQQIVATPTQSGESKVNSPKKKLPTLSLQHSSAPKIIKLDSSIRESSPTRDPFPSIKKQKFEAFGLVDYPAEESDDEIAIIDEEIIQGISSPQGEIISYNLSLRLRKSDLSGINNSKDVKFQACEIFMEDDQFLKTQAFKEYVWRLMKDEYTTFVKKRRSDSPEKPQ